MTKLSLDSTEQWRQKLRFFRLDENSVTALRIFRAVVDDEFDHIADSFYAHIGQFEGQSRKNRHFAKVSKLKTMQRRHWLKIFEANFDADYQKDIKAIGRLHHRAGIGPSTLLGGYAYIGSEFLALAHRKYSGLFGGRNVCVSDLERALMQITLLNSQIALSVYFKAKTHERVKRVQSLADALEQETALAVADICHLTTDVVSTAGELSQKAQCSSEMAHNVATATAEVLASAEVVSGATEELYTSISEIARQVDRTRTISSTATAIAQDGNQTIAALAETVDHIGSVVDLISAIAHQTHMLALNAKIEATRNGQLGQGFSVVADEVKALANRASDATQQISQKIKDVRAHTEQAVAVFAQSSSTLAQLDDAAASIAAAIEEQTSTTAEIAHSVGDNAASARQVSQMIEEMAQHAAQTFHLSADLLKDGNRINATIGVLKTGLTRVARTTTADAERRQSPRHGVMFSTGIKTLNAMLEGTITNLSSQGCCVQTAHSDWNEASEVFVECQAMGPARRATVVRGNATSLHLRFHDDLDHHSMSRLAREGASRIVTRAMQDHKDFMSNIYAAVGGTGQTKASDLANHHTCRLGKWYDQVSDDHIRSSPAFGLLADPHKRVHSFGKAALKALAHGDHSAAEAAMSKARQASEEVLSLLDILDQQITENEISGNVIELRRAG